MLRTCLRVCSRWTRSAAMVLGCCATLLVAGCQTELFGSLEESDANAVLDVLYAEGISAEKTLAEGSTWRVTVDESELQRSLHITRQAGIPHERFANMGELFKKEGLVSSPSEERLRYIFAVSQELSATLSQIDGVVSARVHPVIPANDPLADKVRPSSAAVFIKHKADADLQQMAPAIKNLVTRSIEGLLPEQVSLTFVATRVQPLAASVAPQRAKFDQQLAMVAGALAIGLALALVALGLMYRRMLARREAAWQNAGPRALDGVVRPLKRA